MRRYSAILTIALTVAASAAEAKLDLYVDKSSQRISVVQNGALLYVWPISTGRDQFATPSGIYAPERLERSWFSKAYYNAPMPHAIFFHNGYAIHGSYDIARLGGPASHGCVRLHPQDAAVLFSMVAQEGPGNTTIVIGGDGPPDPRAPRYRDGDDRFRSAYLGDGRVERGAYPPSQRTVPNYNADRYVEAPDPRRGNAGQVAPRVAYPVNRPPAPRRDAQASIESTNGVRGGIRPVATSPVATSPVATSKGTLKCPGCASPREPDEPPAHHVNPSETVRPPSPATAAPEQQQPSPGYKILPKSYWAGASWRWRFRPDQEIR